VWVVEVSNRRRVGGYPLLAQAGAPMTAQPKMKRILITERAKEVLLIMAEGADISEWIMNEWDGYCEMYGQPNFEVG
jgi:hypothetical protein